MVLSMDALFGLPRKKSAGISYRDAIHGHYFFNEQAMVDEFVASAPVRKKKDEKVYYSCALGNICIILLYMMLSFRCAVNSLLEML